MQVRGKGAGIHWQQQSTTLIFGTAAVFQLLMNDNREFRRGRGAFDGKPRREIGLAKGQSAKGGAGQFFNQTMQRVRDCRRICRLRSAIEHGMFSEGQQVAYFDVQGGRPRSGLVAQAASQVHGG
jgi:hypothetical protein